MVGTWKEEIPKNPRTRKQKERKKVESSSVGPVGVCSFGCKMYRSAAKRMLQFQYYSSLFSKQPISIPTPPPRHHLFRLLSSAAIPKPPFSNQNHDAFNANTSSADESHDPPPSSDDDSFRRTSSNSTPRANYQEEQARVLAASLHHVIRLGWTEAAMIAGAKDVGVSPSIVGSIPRKEGALVEYFMDECLQKLIDIIDSGELQLQDLVPSERIGKLIKARLQMQASYISKWPQALSIQAQPTNFPTSFKQRAMLVDELWHAASASTSASNDERSGVDWYLNRTVVGGIYSTTEVYMLTDNSTDFHDTWVFLNERVRDAFDLKKTFQEVKYFAEAVGAGLGGSLQGFTKKGY